MPLFGVTGGNSSVSKVTTKEEITEILGPPVRLWEVRTHDPSVLSAQDKITVYRGHILDVLGTQRRSLSQGYQISIDPYQEPEPQDVARTLHPFREARVTISGLAERLDATEQSKQVLLDWFKTRPSTQYDNATVYRIANPETGNVLINLTV